MSIILIVDDDQNDLSALNNAISRRFKEDYQIESRLSVAEALDLLNRAKENDQQVALVIADQWMPQMNGIDFLVRAHEMHPSAQRALLVSWGDRSAGPTILQGCAFHQIENYLQKPWDPAEIYLYPAVGEFLTDWTRAHGSRMELVRVVGKTPSPRAHEICDLLERSAIPYGYHSAETDEGEALLKRGRIDPATLPAVILLDGSILLNPSNSDILDALGATDLEQTTCDLAIVGGGPAGLAAGVYGASEGLSTIIIEREAIGGQAGTSALIRNYLGFPRGISGAELAQRAYQQAWLFGAKYVLAREVSSLRANGAERILTLANGLEITAQVIVIATGASYQRLTTPGLERFVGSGVFYNTPADIRPFTDRNVCVIGSGNAAGQAVVHLAKTARQVVLAVRGDRLEKGMSDYMAKELQRLPNLVVRFHTEITGARGESVLEAIDLFDGVQQKAETIPADALFVFIGAQPHTDWLEGTLQRSGDGSILTGRRIDLKQAGWLPRRAPFFLETSMPGVFAAGDVRMDSVKRVASAVGEGAVAVQYAHEYRTSPIELPAENKR